MDREHFKMSFRNIDPNDTEALAKANKKAEAAMQEFREKLIATGKPEQPMELELEMIERADKSIVCKMTITYE
jgi:hypothetical protein